MFKPAKIMITGILLAAMIPVSAMALYDPENVVEPVEGEMRITTMVGAPDATAGGETGSYGGTAESRDADEIRATTVVDDAATDQAANSGIVPADEGVMTITGAEPAIPLAESQAAPQNQAVQMMNYLFAIAAAVILGAAIFIFRRIKAVKMH